MIVEGIVTTVNEDGSPNVSPMGPRFSPESTTRFVLRPFTTSTTYGNLKRDGHGVWHVTDDVFLLARAAVGQLDAVSVVQRSDDNERYRLIDCCRWSDFRVTSLDDSSERTTIECEIVRGGRVRDFLGFNRGKHAVVEVAILATRVGIIGDDEIRRGVEQFRVLVEKTGGEQERAAMDFLVRFLEQQLS